ENEKRHVENMADLHLRTIEALALAIEADDCTNPGHIRRVEVYALEIGRDLGLDDSELKALRAAALLHDIGKLAVPGQILSKPGQLSAMEFEKIKIHSSTGAEILEQVEFPYPVASIVRAHHEKWDGTGYPLGLRGKQIPIGARILAAVDCLDSLSSDREYRQAMPPADAMRYVAAEAGRSFDPEVVDVLARRHTEFAKIAQSHPEGRPGQRHGVVEAPMDFFRSIAAARREARNLFELMHDLGSSLSLDETLSM